MQLGQAKQRKGIAIAFLIGISSLAAQFVYNRLIFFYVANSEYAAASIVTLHLLGFLIGTLLARRAPLPTSWLLVGAIGVVLASYALVWQLGVPVLGLVPSLMLTVAFSLLNALMAGWIVVRLMHGASEAEGHGSRIVIADSAGSVIGAAVAGFIIVPRFGLEVGFWVVIGLLLLASAISGLQAEGIAGRRRYRLAGAGVFAGFVLATVLWLPALGPDVSLPQGYARVQGLPLAISRQENESIIFSERSVFGLVTVVRGGSAGEQQKPLVQELYMDSRGLCAAAEEGAPVSRMSQSEWVIGAQAVRWAGVNGNAPKVGIIGLGCGVTLAAALRNGPDDVQVRTIEINPVMPKATRLFEPLLSFSLEDERHELVIDDGFRHFATIPEASAYAAVVLDTAWMQNMNATHLFSKEMFENVQKRLRPDGLFIIWSEEYDPFSEVSKIIFRTLQSVFPVVRAEQADDGAMLFYGTSVGNAPRLDGMLKPESTHLNRWLTQSAANAPFNTLNDLAMNRAKFTWFGDSTFDRLFQKYSTTR